MILHEDRLRGLHHRLVTFVRLAGQLLDFDVMVVSGRRGDEEQALLYAKGRTIKGEPPYTEEKPLGSTVTKALTARDTAHGRGAAVDLCPVLEGHALWKDHEKFYALGVLAKRNGLEWGGDFPKDLQDFGHVQVPGWRGIPYP